MEKANKTVDRAKNILEEVADTVQTVKELKVGCTLYSSNKCTLPLSVYKLKTRRKENKSQNTYHILVKCFRKKKSFVLNFNLEEFNHGLNWS
jgi:hypothetical protein